MSGFLGPPMLVILLVTHIGTCIYVQVVETTSSGSSVDLGHGLLLEVKGLKLRYHTKAMGDLPDSPWAHKD